MHLLIVHQNFADYDCPGGTRHLELARHFVRQGHRCTVIAGGVDFMTGKPLDRKPLKRFGVEIRRAYALPTVHHSYVGRAASYLSFMVTSVWEGLRVGRVDVVLGTSPPMFQLPSAWLIARLRRARFVLEVRDLWPDFAVDMGVIRNPFLIETARRVEHFFYRRQDWAIINSPGFRQHLVEAGVPSARLTTIPNGVETSMFDPSAGGAAIRQRFGLEGKFVAVYAGSLGFANDLPTLLCAAERLATQDDIRFLIVGGGKQEAELRKTVEERRLHNVVLGGPVRKSEVAQVLAAADICLATLRDVDLFRTVYPNKVFDYMAAGKPTILSIDGVIRDVIEQADAGTFVAPGDDQALADAVLHYWSDAELRTRQGRSARDHVARNFERQDQAVAFEHVLSQVCGRRRSCFEIGFKRGLDILFALIAGVCLSPLIAVVFLLVRWKLGAPAIFKQSRAGRDGRIFTLYKFRSMRDATDAHGKPLPDAERLTPFGVRLRSMSLDELPQLWNILRGDMSLVGPRPLLDRYLDRYTPTQARRHEVRPGITGWAQVNGRNAINWDDKFKLDVWYVDHCSFLVDLQILFGTFIRVVTRDGISSGEHATMPEFMGSEQSTQKTGIQTQETAS